MFGKKQPPPPKPPLPLHILTLDYVVDGQLADGLEEGLISPWLTRLGNPAAELLRVTLPLAAARVQPAGALAAPPAAPPAQFNVWLANIIAVLPGDPAGQQMVTAWAQKTMRKRPVRGVFYVGPYVISGTAMTKETEQAPSFGFVVAVLDASIHCLAPGTRLPDLQSAAMLLGTGRIFGYEAA